MNVSQDRLTIRPGSRGPSNLPDGEASGPHEAASDHEIERDGNVVTYRRNYDPTNREQVASALREEIRTARLKVTLDKKSGRETSPQVKLLAGMTLPPLVRGNRRSGNAQNGASGPAGLRMGHHAVTP